MNEENKKRGFNSYQALYESASVDGLEFFLSTAIEEILQNLACCPDDNGRIANDPDMFFTGIMNNFFREDNMSDLWKDIRAGVSDELIISEYKKVDPDLKYVKWWYGEDCEDLILPHGIEYHLVDVIFAHWSAYDRRLTGDLNETGQLVHRVIRLLRVSFSELRRLDRLFHFKPHESMHAVVNNMIYATSPRETEFFSHFEPPAYDTDGNLLSEGVGLSV
ncbi:hypothetical protein [Spirochaeta dissipatitropha]